MLYRIYRDKILVTNIECNPSEFHPKVSKTANLLLNKSKVGTIIIVKANSKKIEWVGIKKFKKVISGG